MASRTAKKMLKTGGVAKLAKGGAAKEVEYNAKGSKGMEEAKETKGSFKTGGLVPGKKSGGRLDKHARGGLIKRKSGGSVGGSDHSPYSSARKEMGPVKDMAGKGHIGEQPPEVD